MQKLKYVLLGQFFWVTCTFASLTDDFVLGYWWGPAPQKQTEQVWQRVKDAHFNTCGLNWDFSVDDNKKMIRECDKRGMTSWVVDDRVKLDKANKAQLAEAVYLDYQNEKSVSAFYVMDEPSIPQVAASKEFADVFRAKNKNILPFVNLFPIYAVPDQMGVPNYDQYLDAYIKLYKPEVISFDHYAITTSGDRQDYFANLEAVLRAKQRYNLPVWNTILSYEHLFYPRPSEDDMRWQINTSLAYGVQGILYFTYYPCLLCGTSKTAIVDADGNPTELYEIVKRANMRLEKLKSLFLKMKIKNVYHTGPLPPGTRKVPAGFALRPISGSSIILSEFDSQQYIVTNRDRKKKQLVRMAVDTPVVEVFNEVAGQFESQSIALGQYVLDLKPGEGKIIRLR